MVMYDVYIKDVYSSKACILSTTDKKLAEATVSTLNGSMLKTYREKAYLTFKTEEEGTPLVWWYDENVSFKLLEDLLEKLRSRGLNPDSYC